MNGAAKQQRNLACKIVYGRDSLILNKEYTNYDVCISGDDIINIVLAAEKYSGFNAEKVRAKIEEKRVCLRNNGPDEYESAVGEDRDIFELMIEHGYVDPKLI